LSRSDRNIEPETLMRDSPVELTRSPSVSTWAPAES
jgi:hypothetical protein